MYGDVCDSRLVDAIGRELSVQMVDGHHHEFPAADTAPITHL
jgi:hypothetical protein